MGRAEPTTLLLPIISNISNTSGDTGKIRAEHRAKTTKGPDGGGTQKVRVEKELQQDQLQHSRKSCAG